MTFVSKKVSSLSFFLVLALILGVSAIGGEGRKLAGEPKPEKVIMKAEMIHMGEYPKGRVPPSGPSTRTSDPPPPPSLEYYSEVAGVSAIGGEGRKLAGEPKPEKVIMKAEMIHMGEYPKGRVPPSGPSTRTSDPPPPPSPSLEYYSEVVVDGFRN